MIIIILIVHIHLHKFLFFFSHIFFCLRSAPVLCRSTPPLMRGKAAAPLGVNLVHRKEKAPLNIFRLHLPSYFTATNKRDPFPSIIIASILLSFTFIVLLLPYRASISVGNESQSTEA